MCVYRTLAFPKVSRSPRPHTPSVRRPPAGPRRRARAASSPRRPRPRDRGAARPKVREQGEHRGESRVRSSALVLRIADPRVRCAFVSVVVCARIWLHRDSGAHEQRGDGEQRRGLPPRRAQARARDRPAWRRFLYEASHRGSICKPKGAVSPHIAARYVVGTYVGARPVIARFDVLKVARR